MRKVFAIFFALSCGVVSAPLMAQTPVQQEVTQPDRSTPPIERPAANTSITSFATDVLNDQKGIWTAPFHINKGDFEWLAPVGVAGGTLFVFDHKISDAVRPDTSLRGPSSTISNVGLVAPWAVPGTMWLLGAVSHNDHTLEAGRLGVEAAVDSEVVMQVLKLATHRLRPDGSDNASFPSGHTMSAFALASVMSHEYHDKKLVVFGSYGFATAVGLARIGGLNHFPTDVLAGAVLGELIGRYVVNHHAQLANQ